MSDSDLPDAPFSPKEAVAALARRQHNQAARKLAFYEQCGAFYALYNQVASHVVAKAFGISQTAASQLGGCLARDPRPVVIELKYDEGPPPKIYEQRINRDMNRNRNPNRIQRYQRVAAEFERLGEEAFADKYFTEAIRLRIERVIYNIENEGSRRARSGPDPDCAGPDSVENPDDPDHPISIRWLDDPPPVGWYLVGTHASFGREIIQSGDRMPFKNIREAWYAWWKYISLDPPPYPD